MTMIAYAFLQSRRTRLSSMEHLVASATATGGTAITLRSARSIVARFAVFFGTLRVCWRNQNERGQPVDEAIGTTFQCG